MGVRVLSDGENAVLYCSTTDWAFGPVFSKFRGDDCEEEPKDRALRFCRWLECNFGKYESHPIGRHGDPRGLTDHGLERAYSDWCNDQSPLGGLAKEGAIG